MFPKNKINIIYRLLCLISYLIVIIIINNTRTIVILMTAFIFLGLCEMSFRNIELIVITLVLWWLSHLLNYTLLLKIILIIDYLFYYLDTKYYLVEKEEKKMNEKDYIRFKYNKKNKKKGSNNITALYLTVHMTILFLAIMVG